MNERSTIRCQWSQLTVTALQRLVVDLALGPWRRRDHRRRGDRLALDPAYDADGNCNDQHHCHNRDLEHKIDSLCCILNKNVGGLQVLIPIF